MPSSQTIGAMWDFLAYADASEFRLAAAALIDQRSDAELLIGQLDLFREELVKVGVSYPREA